MAEGFISDEDVQKVRDASDIVAIVGERAPVKQRGRDFWCCCPLHNEKTPSFKIDPALQLWHCFGCDEGGDVFAFVMKADDLTFPEAVRKLADRAHIEIAETGGRGVSSSKKARLKDICAATGDFYHDQLMRSRSDDAAAARSYLSGRGFGTEVAKRWSLGFAPGRGALLRHLSAAGFDPAEMLEANVVSRGQDGRPRDRFFNRVMFPIRDVQGDCIAFGGRVIGKGNPKYLNSQETPIFHKSQVLYGLDKAKAAMASSGIAIVVEGYTDVIALHEAGVENAVATLGTALTMRHIRLLSRHARHRIVYLFDGDEAGQRAADRALQFIDASMTPEAGKNKLELCAVTLPDDLDPAEFVEAHGADELRSLIDGAQPLLAYGIERRLSTHDLSTPEGRIRALTDALSVLAPIKGSLLAKDYAVQIAARVHMREQDVLDQLASLKPPRRSFEEEDAAEPRGTGRSSGARADARASHPGQGAAGGEGSRVSGRAPGDAGEPEPEPEPQSGPEPGSQPKPEPGPQSGPEPGSGSQSGPELQALSSAERNRLRFEQEFLSLVAQHPLLALEHADALAQTQWHDDLHAQIAQSMLATLSEDPASSAATVIAAAGQVSDRAPGVLTSGSVEEGSSSESVAAYLAEELSLGDAEDAVASMKARLAHAEDCTREEAEITFNSLVDMQKNLARRRRAHVPPS